MGFELCAYGLDTGWIDVFGFLVFAKGLGGFFGIMLVCCWIHVGSRCFV